MIEADNVNLKLLLDRNKLRMVDAAVNAGLKQQGMQFAPPGEQLNPSAPICIPAVPPGSFGKSLDPYDYIYAPVCGLGSPTPLCLP
jgi:hypothetical protein